MIVCSCHAVRDRDIERHAREGCVTVRDLARRCGAGNDCGSCVAELREKLAACQPARATPPVALMAAAK